MYDALVAMGYVDAYELEPRGYREQLERLVDGSGKSIGSPDDPFVLMCERQPIARYYIKIVHDRCVVIPAGSVKFMKTLREMSVREAGSTLH
jgi:hypothetical protein